MNPNCLGVISAIGSQQGDRFIVGDPLQGRELLSLAELQQRYEFTGFHMRITDRGGLRE